MKRLILAAILIFALAAPAMSKTIRDDGMSQKMLYSWMSDVNAAIAELQGNWDILAADSASNATLSTNCTTNAKTPAFTGH